MPNFHLITFNRSLDFLYNNIIIKSKINKVSCQESFYNYFNSWALLMFRLSLIRLTEDFKHLIRLFVKSALLKLTAANLGFDGLWKNV